jgi:LmbE family N-acetylglucosaminyl deacetylase
MKKVLVIVAHPDDEIIWMGGCLIRNCVINRNWDLAIISLCRRDDTDRASKFFQVCKILNAKGFMSNLEDESLNEIEEEEVIERIEKFLGKNRSYDFVFTHGENGEYGHIRHKDVNKAVRDLVDKKIISCKKLFVFAYVRNDEDCSIDKNADNFINLDSLELKRKKDIIKNVYGFKKGSFEERNCKINEAFKLK